MKCIAELKSCVCYRGLDDDDDDVFMFSICNPVVLQGIDCYLDTSKCTDGTFKVIKVGVQVSWQNGPWFDRDGSAVCGIDNVTHLGRDTCDQKHPLHIICLAMTAT